MIWGGGGGLELSRNQELGHHHSFSKSSCSIHEEQLGAALQRETLPKISLSKPSFLLIPQQWLILIAVRAASGECFEWL